MKLIPEDAVRDALALEVGDARATEIIGSIHAPAGLVHPLRSDEQGIYEAATYALDRSRASIDAAFKLLNRPDENLDTADRASVIAARDRQKDAEADAVNLAVNAIFELGRGLVYSGFAR